MLEIAFWWCLVPCTMLTLHTSFTNSRAGLLNVRWEPGSEGKTSLEFLFDDSPPPRVWWIFCVILEVHLRDDKFIWQWMEHLSTCTCSLKPQPLYWTCIINFQEGLFSYLDSHEKFFCQLPFNPLLCKSHQTGCHWTVSRNLKGWTIGLLKSKYQATRVLKKSTCATRYFDPCTVYAL